MVKRVLQGRPDVRFGKLIELYAGRGLRFHPSGNVDRGRLEEPTNHCVVQPVVERLVVARIEGHDDPDLPAAVDDPFDLPQGDPVHEHLSTQLLVLFPDPVVTVVVDTGTFELQQPVEVTDQHGELLSVPADRHGQRGVHPDGSVYRRCQWRKARRSPGGRLRRCCLLR